MRAHLLARPLRIGLALLLAAGPVTTAHAAAGPDDTPFEGAPVSDTALQKLTARENIAVVASNAQSSSVSCNSVTGNSTTGEASVGGQAFQNAQGMMVVSVNSGNNVSINAALSVSVIVNPAP